MVWISWPGIPLYVNIHCIQILYTNTIPFWFHIKILKVTKLPVDKLVYWTPDLFCFVVSDLATCPKPCSDYDNCSRKSPSLPEVQEQDQCWELLANLGISYNIDFIQKSICLVFFRKLMFFLKAAGSSLQTLWKSGGCSLALGLPQANKSCREAEHNISALGLLVWVC